MLKEVIMVVITKYEFKSRNRTENIHGDVYEYYPENNKTINISQK